MAERPSWAVGSSSVVASPRQQVKYRVRFPSVSRNACCPNDQSVDAADLQSCLLQDALDLTNLCEDRDPPTPSQSPPQPFLTQPTKPSNAPSQALSSSTAGQAQYRQSIQYPVWPTQPDDITPSEMSLLPIVSQFEGQPPGGQPRASDEQGTDCVGDLDPAGDADDCTDAMEFDEAETEAELLSIGRYSSSLSEMAACSHRASSTSSSEVSSASEDEERGHEERSRVRKRPRLEEILKARGFQLLGWRESVKQAGTGLERAVDRFERRMAAKADRA